MSAGDGDRQRFTFLPDPEGGMSSSRSGVEILKLPLVGAELEVPLRSGAKPLIIGSSAAAILPLPFGSNNTGSTVAIAKGEVLVGAIPDGVVDDCDVEAIIVAAIGIEAFGSCVALAELM